MNETQLDQSADTACATNGAENKQRQKSQHQVIIETLHAMGDMKPTRDELQRLARIRRKDFVVLLKELLSGGDIERTGTGTKNDPYLYSVAKQIQGTNGESASVNAKLSFFDSEN